jgi:NAD(P)H-hydrate epimerase
MEDDPSDLVSALRDFAQTHKVIVVLKGERPMIAEPSGCVVVSPTGNSGLGKAGNGDTLTGLVAGFVAQAAAIEIGIFESVVAAVYLAGLAGDIAEEKYGKRVMTASDVRECFHDALVAVTEDEA